MRNIIVVTGASSGMGREFTHQIAYWASVGRVAADEIWVIARRRERLEELDRAVPIPVRPLALDLTDPDDIDAYRQLLAEERPNITILANCAGFGAMDHFENVPLRTHLNMVDLNIKTPIAIVTHSLPYMRAGAHMMNLCSISGFLPCPYINVYAATKAFMVSWSRALGRELAYRGIKVTAACPYWVRTEFIERAQGSGGAGIRKRSGGNSSVLSSPSSKEQPFTNFIGIMDADAVVGHIINDMFRGRALSLPGLPAKAIFAATKLFPARTLMWSQLRLQHLDGSPQGHE
ncbi:SDR family NAD(P)-dependent oxidoreductase [Bifidobacterium vansinderenii]|uniref:Oxidoreductase short-chain dehydrogenase/reductase family n=1 Tax=Bifidobacterium vansinderenii TaxID=1984871 RepID=A0A229W0L2_9BIFI|nr:SDR family NAD(P)-dependent oxidoreductase [Bifidobacterium vansinderenii]OXN01381.1 oxidoreductase short-chain dehydrogenase/reductase family [Bifidobacterium vansinderenii]